MDNKYPIVTLIGSSRFKRAFLEAERKLSMSGHVVLTIVHAKYNGKHRILNQDELKLQDDLHRQKIQMCNKVYVIAVGGYVGQATQREIDFAMSVGKPVGYFTDFSQPTSYYEEIEEDPMEFLEPAGKKLHFIKILRWPTAFNRTVPENDTIFKYMERATSDINYSIYPFAQKKDVLRLEYFELRGRIMGKFLMQWLSQYELHKNLLNEDALWTAYTADIMYVELDDDGVTAKSNLVMVGCLPIVPMPKRGIYQLTDTHQTVKMNMHFRPSKISAVSQVVADNAVKEVNKTVPESDLKFNDMFPSFRPMIKEDPYWDLDGNFTATGDNLNFPKSLGESTN